MSTGNVLNSCEVASDDLTTNVHGYSDADSRMEMSVSSLTGSSDDPDPTSFWLTTEFAGTIKVGTLLGIDAVLGRVAEVLLPDTALTGAVYDEAAPLEDPVLEATMSQVCEGV